VKIAFVHEWLVTYAGAERVLEEMINCFPDADIFSLIEFLGPDNKHFIKEKNVKTSFIQKLPFSKKKYRSYLMLMPIAVEQFDLSEYDIIITSSYAVSKGVLVGPDQLHICMCYSPIRYAWDLQHQYLNESNLSHGLKSILAKYILHKMRMWDTRTSNGVDNFIAISKFIRRRINKAYRRNSKVIYPPVNINKFSLQSTKENYYLIASRMVPYKKIPLIVEAFNKLSDKTLVVIGNGPEFQKCKQFKSPNVKLLGWQPNDVLVDYMQRAKAFIFPALEDFGIVPLEAQACGTPVICYGKGGCKETIIGDVDADKPTGVFFNEQTVDSVVESINYFEENIDKFHAANCRDNALRFNPNRFRNEFSEFVISMWQEFRKDSDT